MGGGGGGPTSTTTTNQLDPSMRAWLGQNYAAAQKVNSQTYTPYNGQMVAPLNGFESSGIGQGAAAASGGIGLGAINQGINNATAAGSYQPQQVSTGTWNPSTAASYMNPYTQQVINTTNQQIKDNLAQTNNTTNAQATAAGAYGGTRQAVANAQNNYYANQVMAQTDAQLNDQAYNNAEGQFNADQARSLAGQQSNQQAGLNAANLGLGSADILNQLGVGQQAVGLGNANAMMQYGGVLQNQQQNENQWNYQNNYLNPQQWPIRGLNALESAVSGIPYGNTSTTQQQNYSNPMSGALGGAASGAAMGSMFGPWGTALGAVGGGLMGLFG
jgi:hypothetical protein